MEPWTYAIAGILAATIIAGCLSQSQGGGSAPANEVNVAKASEMALENQANPDFVVLDVRTAQEFGQQRLRGAVNIDFYAKDFKEQVGALERSKTYLVYCRSGQRSRQAAQVMADLGFTKAYSMKGGISEWMGKKLPFDE
jgi:rhodanese-related sulfurtransferase